MSVESGKQHTVAGMKKIRFQFAALPAEGLLVQLPTSITYVKNPVAQYLNFALMCSVSLTPTPGRARYGYGESLLFILFHTGA